MSTLPQKPQRHFNENKRKIPANNTEEEGATEESGKAPKKRKGNRGNGYGGFQAGSMMGAPGSGFGGFMGNDFMGQGMGFGGFMGMGYQGGYGRRMYTPRRTFEDRHVLDKHRNIYPEEEDLHNILKVVDKVERAFKKISDKFFEDGEGSEREITGVARVGDLAKSLLLKGDKNVDLVVMCSKKPTKTLLESISKSLVEELEKKEIDISKENTDEKSEEDNGVDAKDNIKEETVDEKYEVVKDPDVSGLHVTSSQFKVTITLTSTLLRSNYAEDDDPNQNGETKTDDDKEKSEDDEKMEESANKVEEAKKEEEVDPEDLLPEEFGLKGLAELRRAKWFSAMAAPLPSCVEAIRVMKDKTRRDPAWGHLGDWALELLVERSLFSAGYTMSPSKSIMRIMEVLASGLLLPDGPGIKDPCEREDVDVFEKMSSQMKEDVTKQAQIDLRNIHYRKIHLMLGMERLLTRKEEMKVNLAKKENENKDGDNIKVEDQEKA